MHIDGLMDQFTQPVCNESNSDHQKMIIYQAAEQQQISK